MTRDLRTKAQEVDIRQVFVEQQRTVDDGWDIASGSSVSSAGLNLSAEKVYDFSWFWETGGSIRFKITPNDTDATIRRFYFSGRDTDFKIQLAVRGSNGNTVFELRNGSGNNYYTAGQTVTVGQENDVVLVWDPSVPSLTSFLNGENEVTDTVAGSANFGAYDTEYKTVKFGSIAGGTSVTDLNTMEVTFFRELLNEEEAADLNEETTYSELDAKRTVVSLPLITNYNDGSNDVTDNLGSGGTFTWGDGSTASTQPTQLTPHGMTCDGGDYVQAVDNTVADMTTNDFSVVVWFKTDTAAAIQRILWKDDGSSGYRLYLDTNPKLAIFPRDGANSADIRTATLTLADGQWHCGVYVHDKTNGTAYLYVDGEQEASGDISSVGSLTNTDKLTIGTESDGTDGLDGDITRPRIFPTIALTPLQVRELFNRDSRTFNG